MTGIILNQTMYAEQLTNITLEESPRIWDAYSFMYAIAKLCCCGEVVTSSHLLFKQKRLKMTDISNNARNDGIYYYEPKGRMNQMHVWANAICELPISLFEKQYMVIKIIYDTIELATRIFIPGYVDEVRKTVPKSDFEVYEKRIASLEKSKMNDEFYREGNDIFRELFGTGISECEDERLTAYQAERIRNLR